MDDGDLVVELEQRQLAQFEQQRKRAASQPSAKFCIDCDEPIPEARRQYIQGVQRCVVCQGAKE